MPASEGLPRHQAGVGDGVARYQGTRDSAAGQCTVDQGRPHWTVRPCAFRSPSLDTRWKCYCPQCPPGSQEVEEGRGCPSHLLPRQWQRPVSKSGSRVGTVSLGSHRVPGKRGSLLPRSLLAGSPSVLSSHQISQGRGNPGAHTITHPGDENPPYLLWAERECGWCDAPLDQRRHPPGCVPATCWDSGGHWGQITSTWGLERVSWKDRS